MADLAQDLIAASLRKIGVLASGEALPASDAADALGTLNRMIDTWSTEQLLIPSKLREVFATAPAQQTYTFGTGGNWNSPRPQRIEEALIQLPAASGSLPLELPIEIMNQTQYASLVLKTMASTLPRFLYSDGAYPRTNVSLWPVPADATTKVVLYSWKPLTGFATLTTAFSFPPGYEDAIIHNLAIRLAPDYGKEASESVVALAVQTKAAIKRMNVKPRYLRCDDSLNRRHGMGDAAGGGLFGLVSGGGVDAGGEAIDGGTF